MQGMQNGKTVLDNSLKTNYTASSVDVSGGKATLNLDFSSGVYQEVDKNAVALSVAGKNAGQINQAINSSMGDHVTKVNVSFWPFWVTRAPDSQKAIKIELKF